MNKLPPFVLARKCGSLQGALLCLTTTKISAKVRSDSLDPLVVVSVNKCVKYIYEIFFFEVFGGLFWMREIQKKKNTTR